MADIMDIKSILYTEKSLGLQEKRCFSGSNGSKCNQKPAQRSV